MLRAAAVPPAFAPAAVTPTLGVPAVTATAGPVEVAAFVLPDEVAGAAARPAVDWHLSMGAHFPAGHPRVTMQKCRHSPRSASIMKGNCSLHLPHKLGGESV